MSLPPSTPQHDTWQALEARGFVLGRTLGTGATATVRAATHADFGEVALKVGRSRMAGPAFRHEQQILDRLQHPGIPTCYERIPHVEGVPVLVLSRFWGAIPERPRSVRKTVALTISLLSILDHVHRRGIVHCDLKRHNVLVGRRPQLVDFGVAREVGEESSDTMGRVAGTPAYMAPEVLRGQAVDERTDLYSLAVFLYFGLTGRFPFPHDEGRLHLASKRDLVFLPASLTRASVPSSLDDLVREMLSPLRSQRPSASDVRDRLRALLPELRPSNTSNSRVFASHESGTTRKLAQ